MNKKKILLVIAAVAVVAAAWVVLQSKPDERVETGAVVPSPEAIQPQPAEVTVGLYDPASQPSDLTQLLESRLTGIGFQTTILKELPDPDAANQERATLLYRSNTQPALAVVVKHILATPLYRQGQNEAILSDVVISAWNIEDISWGELAGAAEQLNQPNPSNVTVTVTNAGAGPETVEQVAGRLRDAGFTQTVATTSTATVEKSMVIYYQRNFKKTTKDVKKILSDNGYRNASYRIRLQQTSNLNVLVGAEVTREQPQGQGLAGSDDLPLHNTSTVKILILNGSGIAGRAKQAAQQLVGSGFPQAETGNAENVNSKNVTIRHRGGWQAVAENIGTTLREEFGDVIVVLEESLDQRTDITVILGKRSP